MVTTQNKQSADSQAQAPADHGDVKIGNAGKSSSAKTKGNASKAGESKLDTEKDIVYIGMDLGTSRTAIAASNGVRESLPSLIGYPKDVVAQKLLARDVLFGKDVIKHRLSLKTFRPLAKGVIKGSTDDGVDAKEAEANMIAARQLVKHAIEMARAPADSLVYCVIGAPAEASINNRHAILEAAKEVIDSVMICSEPFAVAYGMDVLSDALVIDIGAGTTDLCRMHGTLPEDDDQVTIDYAGDAIDDKLVELIKAAHPDVSFSRQMAIEAKEDFATVSDTAQPIIVEWPVKGKPTKIDITEQMKEACHSIVPHIVDALGEIVASFDPEFQVVLRNNVLLGGGGSQIRGLADAISEYMGEHLGGGHVTQVEEPVFAGSNGALKISKDMPTDFWEQLS
ncbi:MAG: rod shape-determining protein [Planctomycetota bacterium]|nr:MAG: rod shape-determining protein [Planctomycetota bacterium]